MIEQKLSSLKRGMLLPRKRGLVESPGKDFLFLFDLIAHTCGISATLRVLSFSAHSFEEFCQPRILEKMMQKTESSVTVKWDPASLQNKSSNKLKVDMYVATIFPGNKLKKVEVGREVSFTGLSGGTQEYIVTVSAMVNNAKMKGARTTFHLPPFPPQKLHCELCIVEQRCRLTTTWTAPRGDFHKYSLRVTRSLAPETGGPGGNGNPGQRGNGNPGQRGNPGQIGVRSLGMSLRGARKLSLFPEHGEDGGPEEEIWLPKEAERHVLENLFPGEMYRVELRSMTGDTQKCCETLAPSKVVCTPPLPPHKLQVDMESAPGSLQVSWSPPPPPGHSSLSGYKLQIRRKTDDVILLERILSRNERKLEVDPSSLVQATEYMVRLQTMAEGRVNIETDIRVNSEFVETMFVLAPPPPTGLKLDGTATASQLKVKWDPPVDHPRSTYTVSIKPVTGDQSAITPDETVSSNNFTFSRLDSGQAYHVSVMTSLKMSDRVYHSSALSSVMITKPLPPPEMTVSCPETQEFVWKRSPSQAVSKYEFKIKKDDERATDFVIVDEDRDNDIYCRDEVVFRVPFTFEPCVEYKINVYSIVEYEGEVIKSEPLHMKSIKEEVNFRDLDTMERMERQSTIKLSRSNTGVQNSRKSQRLKLRMMNKVEPIPKAKCMSTPTTPVRVSTENLVKNFRKGSMGTEELAISPDQLELLNLLSKEVISANSHYADSISSIEEEVEENQRTLTSAEGKMLAREWMAQSRAGSLDV